MSETLIPCPYCKTPIPDDCIYCDTCGERLRKCSSCGSFAKSKRCTKCGGSTEEIGATPTPTPTPTPTVAQAQPAPRPQPAASASATVRPGMTPPPPPPPSSVPPGHLVCMRGSLRIGLAHDAIIGRRGSYGSAFQIFPTISGLHARLIQNGAAWQIEDIGSSYGTFINGVQLAQNTPANLNVGDIVRFSDIDFKVTE